MKVLYIASRELSYPRNDVILRAFRRMADVDVIGINHRPKSLIRTSVRLVIKALTPLMRDNYDLVFIGFFGQLLVLPISYLTRKPILFDAFVSTYDTLISDRKEFTERSLPGRLAFLLDKTSCNRADLVTLDTPLHVDYFVDTFKLPAYKFSSIPVGCNEELFYPQPLHEAGEKINILYYTSYLPLHGVNTVIEAARQLKFAPVTFRLIGGGQEYENVRRLAASYQLVNIEFYPFIPLGALPGELARADIALAGHFGMSEKAGRVVPGKVYQVLASARPLIAGDTPANRQLLTHGKDAWLCRPGDPQALAQAILSLSNDQGLRKEISTRGRELYDKKCSEAIITDQLRALMASMHLQ